MLWQCPLCVPVVKLNGEGTETCFDAWCSRFQEDDSALASQVSHPTSRCHAGRNGTSQGAGTVETWVAVSVAASGDCKVLGAGISLEAVNKVWQASDFASLFRTELYPAYHFHSVSFDLFKGCICVKCLNWKLCIWANYYPFKHTWCVAG